MRVWRVAHESTLQRGFPAGPYNGGVELKDATRDVLSDMYGAHCDDDHPSPYWDLSLNGIGPSERCGFNSPDALYDWFAGWTAALDECGFRVWTYDVPEWACTVGTRGQVVFTADEAVEVSSEPLNIEPEQLTLFA